ncbi:VOC family protein [Actinomadura sp. NPDC049753]|uniref:VOC family protein n=1 Tax=Actinomadura sp. NPDC049753 TaxID=3154739 RepID=UPI003447642A
MNTTKKSPERYRNAVISHAMIRGAKEALAFYEKAFGAEVIFRIDAPDGTLGHTEIAIEGSTLMLSEAHPPFVAPDEHGSSVVLHVYVDDVDAVVARAESEGAEIIDPPADAPFGARAAILRDPFGHTWVFLTHIEDVPDDVLERRMNAHSD